MEEWKTYLVEDLFEEIAMGPFGSNIKVDCFQPTGIPVLNGSNLFGFKWDTCKLPWHNVT